MDVKTYIFANIYFKKLYIFAIFCNFTKSLANFFVFADIFATRKRRPRKYGNYDNLKWPLQSGLVTKESASVLCDLL